MKLRLKKEYSDIFNSVFYDDYISKLMLNGCFKKHGNSFYHENGSLILQVNKTFDDVRYADIDIIYHPLMRNPNGFIASKRIKIATISTLPQRSYWTPEELSFKARAADISTSIEDLNSINIIGADISTSIEGLNSINIIGLGDLSDINPRF